MNKISEKEEINNEIYILEKNVDNSVKTLDSQKELKNIINSLQTIISKIQNSEIIIDSIEKMNECPTCGQNINEQSIKNAIIRVLKMIKNLKESIKEFENFSFIHYFNWIEEIQQQNISISIIKEKITNLILSLKEFKIELEKKLEKKMIEYQEEQNIVNKKKLKLLELQNDILKLENEKQKNISNFDKEINVLESEIKQKEKYGNLKKQEMEELKEKIFNYNQQLEELQRNFQREKFWELAFDKKSKSSQGFSTLRASILEDSIVDLNSIFQTYLEKLSPNNRQLTVTLTPDLELEENYGKRSGGERKRTDLVTLFASKFFFE